MSRGLGKTQRLILDTLDAYGPFYLCALCDGDLKTRYKSLFRAADCLERQGLVASVKYRIGLRKVVICRHGESETGDITGFMGIVVHGPIHFDRKQVEATSMRLIEDRRSQ